MSLIKWLSCCLLCGYAGYFSNGTLSPANDISKISTSALNTPAKFSAEKKITSNNSFVDCNKPSIVKQQSSSTPSAATNVDAEITRLHISLLATQSQLEEAKRELALAKINRKFTTEIDSSLLFKQVENRFEEEPVDLEWAPRREKELSNLFVENDKLLGVAVKNMQCKSDQCKIVLAATRLEDANKSFESLFHALGDNGGYVSLVASPDVQQNMTTLYVSREDKDFEFK